MTNKLLTSLIAVAGFSLCAAASAPAQAMDKAAYNAAKDQAKAQYDADYAGCKPMAGNARDVCELQAKGKRDVSIADADALYKNTPDAQYDARLARVEASYKVAKEKCDDLTGNPKDVCVKQAQAAEVKGKADAKVNKVAVESEATAMKKTAEAKKDAAEDKMDAEYKVAVERCDSLAGDAKGQCVKAAKTRFGKS